LPNRQRNGLFEWKVIIGVKGEQPYAIDMRSDEPLALAALW
jgi:hypothetical protein